MNAGMATDFVTPLIKSTANAMTAKRFTRLDATLAVLFALAGAVDVMEHQLKDGTYLQGDTMTTIAHEKHYTQRVSYSFKDQIYCVELLGTGEAMTCVPFSYMDALLKGTPSFSDQVFEEACETAHKQKRADFTRKYCL